MEWCSPLYGSVSLFYVCKQNGGVDCFEVWSGDECKNLIDEPFAFGKSGGNYSCSVYSGDGCTGTKISVDSIGRDFPFRARSIECPCLLWGWGQ